MNKAHKSIKKIRKIKSQLGAFQKQYKGNENVKGLLEKAKTMSEEFTKIEEALYQTKNRSGQDPLNFPIRLTNKLGFETPVFIYIWSFTLVVYYFLYLVVFIF